jgi:hypothetical protein
VSESETFEDFDNEQFDALRTKEEKQEYMMRRTSPEDDLQARITNGQLLRVQQIIGQTIKTGTEPMREQLGAVQRFLLAVLYDTDRTRGTLAYDPEKTWDALDRLPIVAGGPKQPRSGQRQLPRRNRAEDGEIGDVQQLVDAMIDRARTEHPDIEFTVFISAADSLRLPRHSTRLWRDGGYYTGHVYRDLLVEDLGRDDVVGLVAHDRAAPTYYGILATGAVTTESPYPAGE